MLLSDLMQEITQLNIEISELTELYKNNKGISIESLTLVSRVEESISQLSLLFKRIPEAEILFKVLRNIYVEQILEKTKLEDN